MLFYIFLGVIIIQRLAELWIARKNEIWMKKQGAQEFGQNHYKFMVFIHISFFVCLLLEVMHFHRTLIPHWWVLFSLFLVTQIGRIWVIMSLGRFWNTKIIVLPNANIITKGPYKYINHPNYLIVTLELIIIPLMFQAYYTLGCFFLLNQLILAIRIPFEERVLEEQTDYNQMFQQHRRFIPRTRK